jgi:phosphomannomutase
VVAYQHSSISRDIIPVILKELGAGIVPVGRSDKFVAVDTEAVEAPDMLAAWVKEHGADALVSADGDGDRPLVVNEKGIVVRGDMLGIITADFLGADSVSAPVSCNTALEKSGLFAETRRSQIGSPFVIASMQEAVQAGRKTVAGYEANGGFLLATDAVNRKTGAILKALPTRDAVLPIVASLMAAKRKGGLSRIVEGLPARFTASGLIRDFPSETGAAVVRAVGEGGKSCADRFFAKAFGPAASLDFTDGARITFNNGDVVHLRPSGNAPEFRCYTESFEEALAVRMNEQARRILRKRMLPAVKKQTL